MESGNLLTGAKYINIDFYPDAAPAAEGSFMEYTTIPSIETGFAQLEQRIKSILETVDGLPLDATLANANTALATLNQSLVGMQSILENQSTQQLPVQLDKTLQELRDAISNLSPDSEAYRSLNSSLLSLNRTMGNLETLTRTLAEQPSAVLISPDPEPDPIPEVNQQ